MRASVAASNAFSGATLFSVAVLMMFSSLVRLPTCAADGDIIDGLRRRLLAKIATDLDRALRRRAAHGTPGRAADRLLASGEEWSVSDVICTSGPADTPFEEQ